MARDRLHSCSVSRACLYRPRRCRWGRRWDRATCPAHGWGTGLCETGYSCLSCQGASAWWPPPAPSSQRIRARGPRGSRCGAERGTLPCALPRLGHRAACWPGWSNAGCQGWGGSGAHLPTAAIPSTSLEKDASWARSWVVRVRGVMFAPARSLLRMCPCWAAMARHGNTL